MCAKSFDDLHRIILWCIVKIIADTSREKSMKMNVFRANMLIILFAGLVSLPVIAEELESHFPEDNDPDRDQPKETMSPEESEVFEAERRELHEKLNAMSPEDREEYREERLDEEREILAAEKLIYREQRIAEIMSDMTPVEREKFLANLELKKKLSKERSKKRRNKKKNLKKSSMQ